MEGVYLIKSAGAELLTLGMQGFLFSVFTS